MNPAAQLEATTSSVEEILTIIEYMISQGEELPEELQVELAELLNQAGQRITDLRSQAGGQGGSPLPPGPPSVPGGAPTPPGADLLWILAGGQEDAFVQYLRTFPDQELNAIVRNPGELTQLIAHLNQTMPQGQQQSQDGIEKAPLNSSNIYGFQYDPKSGNLRVRFQGGSVYGYSGVPPAVFKIFQQGAVPAKTDGQNKYGMWYRGKVPSYGAAFHELVKLGGYPYQKLK